jgi:hypothetical protein
MVMDNGCLGTCWFSIHPLFFVFWMEGTQTDNLPGMKVAASEGPSTRMDEVEGRGRRKDGYQESVANFKWG